MSVDVIVESGAWVEKNLQALGETTTNATLHHLGFDPNSFESVILACDDARIADLNRDFRNKPTPTNVLSWPTEERGASHPGGTPAAPTLEELGDIAIAYETCEREAAEADKPFDAHVSHLLIHGTLHLLGYDHIDDADAGLMERLEVEILATLGHPDPY